MTRSTGDGRASRRAFLDLGVAAVAAGVSGVVIAAESGDHAAAPARAWPASRRPAPGAGWVT